MIAKPKKGLSGRPVPRFPSVERESDYWDKHSPLDRGDWEAVSYEEVCADLAARGEGKQAVTLRLEPKLVRRLKNVARRHRLKYQALAREILWRSLLRRA